LLLATLEHDVGKSPTDVGAYTNTVIFETHALSRYGVRCKGAILTETDGFIRLNRNLP
jgi:hypothetical protein